MTPAELGTGIISGQEQRGKQGKATPRGDRWWEQENRSKWLSHGYEGCWDPVPVLVLSSLQQMGCRVWDRPAATAAASLFWE